MKARAMRKPIYHDQAPEDVERLLRKEEEVKRYLDDIKTAAAAIERIMATEKGKSTYEIRYVADIDDYYM